MYQPAASAKPNVYGHKDHWRGPFHFGPLESTGYNCHPKCNNCSRASNTRLMWQPRTDFVGSRLVQGLNGVMTARLLSHQVWQGLSRYELLKVCFMPGRPYFKISTPFRAMTAFKATRLVLGQTVVM